MAGVSLIANNVEDSTINIDAVSEDNVAINYHFDPNERSNADAGVDV